MNLEALENKIMSLRHTLSWMDLVMANVNECILVLDKDWRVVFVNSYMAELLNKNRVLLLGKYFWEIVPIDIGVTGSKRRTVSIGSISRFNGVYDLDLEFVQLKMLLQGKYIHHLQQALCIMSDLTIELVASNELMKMHKKIAVLEAKLAKQRLKSE